MTDDNTLRVRSVSMTRNKPLRVRSSLRAGRCQCPNHNKPLRVRSSLRAGRCQCPNHNKPLRSSNRS